MTLTYQFYFVVKMIFFGKEDRGKKVTGITVSLHLSLAKN